MRLILAAALALLISTCLPVDARTIVLYCNLQAPGSIDLVSDQFDTGRRFRILAIYDDCTRECLAAVADVSLSGLRNRANMRRLRAPRSCWYSP